MSMALWTKLSQILPGWLALAELNQGKSGPVLSNQEHVIWSFKGESVHYLHRNECLWHWILEARTVTLCTSRFWLGN